ncbi:MAG: DNA repair protein RadC [Gammaproteobacteria bacterium]|nr:DNA repair protein RadC [Gammaproteobacteria bacterium]MCY4182108.1 DNA repair protein RadC [Gammaproteobacteria bacterium]MCY4270683.1 DNA repair protein RadC [Gammaproteobacteria bacterium]MCY4296751.1 DNA repair protein RadC [Gammaproteobacteria bacterium]
MTIKNWPTLERPREKLFEHGAKNLSDAELLALLLGSGGAGRSAIDLARDLLYRFNGLAGVLASDLRQISQVPGIGPAKAAMLTAIGELGHRRLYAEVKNRDVLSCSEATREYLRARFHHCKSEIFSCIFLTNQHHILKLDEMFQGTIDATVVYPREIVERCLAYNAAAVILAHNHPSGVPEPSQADIVITRKLRVALETIDVRVLDHIIVGSSTVVSLAERGLL